MEKNMKQRSSYSDRYFQLHLSVNYVKSRMEKQNVFNQMIDRSNKILGVQASKDQNPEDLPWSGDKYDGSFLSYKIIMDTQITYKNLVLQQLQSFAEKFAACKNKGKQGFLQIIQEEYLQIKKVENLKEDQEEEKHEKEPSLLKDILQILQKEIQKLKVSQQQIKEQQKKIQDTLTNINVYCVKQEDNQGVQKVQMLSDKINKDQQSLKQIEIFTEQIKQIALSGHQVQLSEDEQSNIFIQKNQEQPNVERDKQNNNIQELKIDGNSIQFSENQSLDNNLKQSLQEPISPSNKLDQTKY
ncbi:hypothetical protein ABPG74_002038 [Tetrahymena malaccensis]